MQMGIERVASERPRQVLASTPFVMGKIRGGIADHACVEAMTATGVLSKDGELVVVRLQHGVYLLSQRVHEPRLFSDLTR